MSLFSTSTTCKFIPPSLHGWMYAVLIHGLSCVFAIVLGTICYFCRRRRHGHTGENHSSLSIKNMVCIAIGIVVAALVAIYNVNDILHHIANYGVVGSSLLSPLHDILLQQQHPILWVGPFLVSTFGFNVFFKSINSGYGTYPMGADSTLPNFLLWYVLLPEPEFIKGKLVCRRNGSSTTCGNTVETISRTMLTKIVALCVVLTVLKANESTDYRIQFFLPPSSTTGETRGSLVVLQQFIQDALNGYVYIFLLYLFASFCLDFSAITSTIGFGIVVPPGFNSPHLSRCYKEGWGSRWNIPIHVLLKRTVYIPVRDFVVSQQQHASTLSSSSSSSSTNKRNAKVTTATKSKSSLSSAASNNNSSSNDTKIKAKIAASCCTFLASGLLHEYNFYIHNYPGYKIGHATVFFILMGVLMMSESIVYETCCPTVVKNLMSVLPSVITGSVIFLSVSWPCNKYFVRSWIESGFVDAVLEMLPHFQCT